MSTSASLKRRLEKLEAMQPDPEFGRAFFWPHGKSLDHALAVVGLTLADKPLLAIR